MASTFHNIKDVPGRLALGLAVTILLAACSAGQRGTPIELSDSRPSLLFFYIDN